MSLPVYQQLPTEDQARAVLGLDRRSWGRLAGAGLLGLLMAKASRILQAAATITIDVADTFSTDLSATSHTYPSLTIANQPNRLILVGVGKNENIHASLAVAFGAAGLTQQIEATTGGGAQVHADLFFLRNPTPSTANLVVTTNNAARVVMTIFALYNVDQSTTFRDSDAVTVSTNSTTLTLDSAVGDMLFDFVFVRGNAANDPGALVPGTATEIEELLTGSIHRGSARRATAVGSSMTAAWTWTSASSNGAQVAATIIPAASPGGATGRRRRA